MSETFVAPTLFSSPLENGEEKRTSAGICCGLGWACHGASLPKNGNNRPRTRLLENFPGLLFFPSSKACRLLNDVISYRRERLMLRYAGRVLHFSSYNHKPMTKPCVNGLHQPRHAAPT